MPNRLTSLAMVVSSLLALAACRQRELPGASKTASADSAAAMDTVTGRDSRDLERPNDYRITTNEGAVNLVLRHDSVLMALSDSIRANAVAEMDSTKTGDSKIGAMIAGAVTGAVKKALNYEAGYALSEIKSVEYADGRIVFRYYGKPHLMSFESMKTNGAPMLSRFAPADARAFVDSVKAHMARK